jgi:hypothetical protein
MLSKYKIEYAISFQGHAQDHHYLTDDPVVCEQVLSGLLERGMRIKHISHDGVELPRPESDRLIKTAVGMLATRHLCASLGIDTIEAHHRFGSPA